MKEAITQNGWHYRNDAWRYYHFNSQMQVVEGSITFRTFAACQIYDATDVDIEICEGLGAEIEAVKYEDYSDYHSAIYKAIQSLTASPAAILGAKGGSAKTEAKKASSKANGAKGGRPKFEFKITGDTLIYPLENQDGVLSRVVSRPTGPAVDWHRIATLKKWYPDLDGEPTLVGQARGWGDSVEALIRIESSTGATTTWLARNPKTTGDDAKADLECSIHRCKTHNMEHHCDGESKPSLENAETA